MRDMTPDEVRDFLVTGTRTAKIASVRGDGRPHVAPVWFVLDGDDIVFTTGHRTVKAVNLRRDPRVMLCVDDETPPYAFVAAAGTATIVDDADELRRWATRIGGRYMGEEQAEAFGRRNAVPGELLVRVTPTSYVAHAEMAV